MNEYILSLDIGGSYIKCALVNEKGGILARDTISTPKVYDEFLKNIAILSKSIGKDVIGAAVALPGGYDFNAGRAFAPNLTLINERDIKNDLENIINKRTVVENDANLAALGEYVFVEKKLIADMIFVTLGTGVGGGLIMKGKLQSKDVTLFEIGHMSTDMNGRLCGCGRRGCLDEYCSVGGLQIIYERFTGVKKADPKEMGVAAGKNDPRALEAFAYYGKLLANALVNVANLMTPEKIKIGGGLSELSQYFMPACADEFEKNIFPLYKTRVKLEIACLKNDAGILGGAALFFGL